jgi:hypothetical protein
MVNNLSTTIETNEVSTLSNFDICYYDVDMAYLQFNCNPPINKRGNLGKLKVALRSLIDLPLGEITYCQDGDMQLSIKGEHTLESLTKLNIPISDEG